LALIELDGSQLLNEAERQWQWNRQPHFSKVQFWPPLFDPEPTKTRHFVIEKSKNSASHSILLQPSTLDLTPHFEIVSAPIVAAAVNHNSNSYDKLTNM